jgi:hypothetical protein
MFYLFLPNTMPNFDGTGPQGQGSYTGRGQGSCTSQMCAGFQRKKAGFCGFGGFSGRFGFCPRMSLSDSDTLEQAEKALEKELESVRKERENLKKK